MEGWESKEWLLVLCAVWKHNGICRFAVHLQWCKHSGKHSHIHMDGKQKRLASTKGNFLGSKKSYCFDIMEGCGVSTSSSYSSLPNGSLGRRAPIFWATWLCDPLAKQIQSCLPCCPKCFSKAVIQMAKESWQAERQKCHWVTVMGKVVDVYCLPASPS